MMWHILKKDVRLLWVLALVAILIRLTAAALRTWMGLFQEPRQLLFTAQLLSLLYCVGIIVLILTLMHQDAVPGVRQDWLVRPIRRRDLVFAKLLFVALIVQAPLLLLDLGEGLASGFGVSAALSASFERNLTILCFLSLPAVVIGAVTRTVVESFTIALLGLIAYAAVFLVGAVMLLGLKTTMGGTGLSWMVGAVWYVLAIIGTAIVISLQFFRRRTLMVRGLIATGGAVILLAAYLPWSMAFALQGRISGVSSSTDAIALTFNPQMGPFKVPPGAAAGTVTGLYLPLHVTGIPSGAIVLMDRANIRITDVGGKPLYEGRSNISVDGVGSIQAAQLEVRQRQDSSAGQDVYQRIFLPASIYGKLRREAVRIEVDYFLTLFRPGKVHFLPASEGRGNLDAFGFCGTRIDDEGDDVQLICVNTTLPPACFTAFLEQPSTGLRNPETHRCGANYAPSLFSEGVRWWEDSLARYGTSIPFFDRSGLTHYPVDGSKLSDSRLRLETYEPHDHFTRRLSTSTVRLSDFNAAPTANSD